MEPSVKDRILLKALELFYQQGVHSTGINQIISESGVAKASFYQYFPSKDDLILACITVYGESMQETLRALMEVSSSFQEFVKNWVRSITERLREKGKRYNGCPVANLRFSLQGDEKYDEVFHAVIGDWLALLQEYLLTLQKKGRLSGKADIPLLARRMIHIHEGALIMWKLTGDISCFEDMESLARKLV